MTADGRVFCREAGANRRTRPFRDVLVGGNCGQTLCLRWSEDPVVLCRELRRAEVLRRTDRDMDLESARCSSDSPTASARHAAKRGRLSPLLSSFSVRHVLTQLHIQRFRMLRMSPLVIRLTDRLATIPNLPQCLTISSCQPKYRMTAMVAQRQRTAIDYITPCARNRKPRCILSACTEERGDAWCEREREYKCNIIYYSIICDMYYTII